MATQQLRTVLRQIRGIIGHANDQGVADSRLLERFVCTGDEAAFEVLVWRHGPMVLALCRRVLRDSHDAEDALQATFLTLARKAGSISKRESVGSWLYKVAYRIALRAKVSAANRGALEKQLALTRPELNYSQPALEATREELNEILDDELNRLPEKYRAPIVLCFLQGKSLSEAAQELDCPRGTISTRLTRAREILRNRLARRDLELSPGAMVADLARSSIRAMSSSLVTTTVKAAALFSTGQAGTGLIISAKASALAKEALGGFLVAKLKLAATILLAVSAFVSGVVSLASLALADKPAHAKQAEESIPVTGADATGPVTTDDTRLDRFGDPLPPGALARLGTLRWRHGDQVMTVAFSPDGKTVASGSMDESIHLFDAKTGKLLQILRGHEGWVTCVLFTRDGKHLISCGPDHTTRMWDVVTGKELRKWKTPCGGKLALSPSGKIIAGLGEPPPNETIVLRDLGSGNKFRELRFEGDHDSVIDIAFSPDGTRLASGGTSCLRLFDLASGQQLQIFGSGKRINSLAFSPDGKTLAVARYEEPVVLWDVVDFKKIRKLDSDKRGARAMAFSRDGKTLAVCGYGPGRSATSPRARRCATCKVRSFRRGQSPSHLTATPLRRARWIRASGFGTLQPAAKSHQRVVIGTGSISWRSSIVAKDLPQPVRTAWSANGTWPRPNLYGNFRKKEPNATAETFRRTAARWHWEMEKALICLIGPPARNFAC